MDGAYGAALAAHVLRFAGEQNLSRMTFFLRAPPINEVWFFGGFDRVDGQLETMTIVGVGQGNQQVIRNEVAGGYEYQLNPVAPVPEDGSVLFSSATAEAATAEEREAAFASFLRVENRGFMRPTTCPAPVATWLHSSPRRPAAPSSSTTRRSPTMPSARRVTCRCAAAR